MKKFILQAGRKRLFYNICHFMSIFQPTCCQAKDEQIITFIVFEGYIFFFFFLICCYSGNRNISFV